MGSAPSSVSVRVKRSSSGGSSTSTVRPGGLRRIGRSGDGQGQAEGQGQKKRKSFLFHKEPLLFRNEKGLRFSQK